MTQRPEDLVELLPGADRFLVAEDGAHGLVAEDGAHGLVAEDGAHGLVAEDGAPGLVLVHDVAGDFDAAHAGAMAGSHLLAGLEHEVIARFDADALVDYRAHRPRVTFSGDRYETFHAPEIALYAVEDDAGLPFLLLHGSEPDYQWERFVAAVAGLVERLGVTTVVALQAIPMPVPHTRPVTVTAHATRRALIAQYPVYWGEMRIPGSVASLLEIRLGEAGVDALGIAAHVPHYLSQATYPAASVTLLEHLQGLTGLHVPVESLREAAEAHRTEVDEQIGRSAENTAVVAALEQQYDAFTSARENSDLLSSEGAVPTAEEIGAEFERFLADQDRKPPRGGE